MRACVCVRVRVCVCIFYEKLQPYLDQAFLVKVLHFQLDVQDHLMLVHLVLSLAILAVWAQEQEEGLKRK